MHDSPDFEASIFGGALGPQVVLRVNRVDASRLINIATRKETSDHI
jgi:hypothetical protein